LSSLIIENTNRLSFIEREQVSEVQVIQVNDFSDKNVANRMCKFMQEVIRRVKLEENKKLLLVEAKHLKGHVGGEMMYHALFRDGYY
jgi:RNA 3'-terminal phosphate cyclase